MSASTPISSEKKTFIVNFLMNGPILKNFTFPRMYLPNLAGYRPEDYETIGRKIRDGVIRVVEAEVQLQGAKAAYIAADNCLKLTAATAPLNTPDHWSTIAHEATHMIQDLKKWRISRQEMEADAHFAQALFLYYKGASLDIGYMPSFAKAAKAFAEGDMKKFKDYCSPMIQEAGTKYRNVYGDDLSVKQRGDGIK